MKTPILGLIFLLLLTGASVAAIIERSIYAGPTPMASACTVTQTGPLQLTIGPCSWTMPGQARVVKKEKAVDLAARMARGEAEMLPDGKRVRGWLKRKDGTIIEKSKRWVLPPTVINWPADGQEYVVFLVKDAGSTMKAVLTLKQSPMPPPDKLIDYLVFETTVPVGAVDFTGIEIEVFTVKPGQPPTKDLFEK